MDVLYYTAKFDMDLALSTCTWQRTKVGLGLALQSLLQPLKIVQSSFTIIYKVPYVPTNQQHVSKTRKKRNRAEQLISCKDITLLMKLVEWMLHHLSEKAVLGGISQWLSIISPVWILMTPRMKFFSSEKSDFPGTSPK